MTDTLIIEKAIDEVQNKSFATTEQILNVHEVVYVDNKPKVLRVDTEKDNGIAIVYFPIKDEKFYLAVYLDTTSEISVEGVTTENYNSVYFRSTTKEMSFEQLSGLTKLTATSGWSKGDLRQAGKSFNNFSSLHFEPNPEPDDFEDKLRKLLDFLEQDREGVSQLVEQANGYVQVVTVFHNSNTMLGGHHIDKDAIKRLSSLNLEVDFDLYAEGNSFTD
jgi:hypothetical protein